MSIIFLIIQKTVHEKELKWTKKKTGEKYELVFSRCSSGCADLLRITPFSTDICIFHFVLSSNEILCLFSVLSLRLVHK